jgi:hypothetical protein
MFEKHIRDFNENILGLREFIDLIDPFLKEKRKEHEEHVSPLIFSGLLKMALAQKEKLDTDDISKFEELQADIENKIIEKYKQPIEILLEEHDESIGESEKESGFKLMIKTQNNPEIRSHIENTHKTNNHIELLYKNALISLMSSVEWFFSQILHYYYNKYPESAGIQKKTMSLSELKTFGTINDAEKYLIDVKVEEILRGNFESWLQIMQNELSLKLGYLNDLKPELVEIYQRRNLFVHNGGVVNSIYLSKVDSKFCKKVNLDTKLNIDKEYLNTSICVLQKSFLLIAAELWKNLDKADRTRGEVISEIVYENLTKERWDICEGLCYFLINDSQIDPIDKVISQLNYWLCKKRTGNYDKVKSEIEKADFSDKKEIFQLGLLGLKEDIKGFIDILPTALDSKQLNIERLEEFPIFMEIRLTDEYQAFKRDSKYFKEPNKTLATLETLEKD